MLPRNLLPIEWTASASEDMDGIADYLLGEGLPFEAVEEYVMRIYNAPEHLTKLPGAGKPGRVPSTREWLIKDTPYALIYDVQNNKIRILRVMHDSRQFPEQLSDATQHLPSTLSRTVKGFEMVNVELLKIEQDTIFIEDKKISDYRYLGELGRGANGIVLKVENKLLGRIEAMKIWLKFQKSDTRDKLKQGIAEIRKNIEVSKAASWIVNVYSAAVVENTLVSCMEYVPGETLKNILKKNLSETERYNIANSYLKALWITSEFALHGDPHTKNVMFYEYIKDKYESRNYIKLLDFGTSIFTSKEKSFKRHWKIVDETFNAILGPLDEYKYCRALMEGKPRRFEEVEALLMEYAKNGIAPGTSKVKNDLEWKKIFVRQHPLVFYKDIIDGIFELMTTKKKNTSEQ